MPEPAPFQKFLLDEGVPKIVLRTMVEAGYDAKRVQDLGPRGITNGEVIKLAFSTERVLLSRDSDFLKLSRRIEKGMLGVVYLQAFRDEPDQLASHVSRFISECLSMLKTCEIVALRRDGPDCIVMKRP